MVLLAIVLTKSDEWTHEQEVRVMYDEVGSLVVPPENVTGVVFGVRAAKANIEYIVSIIDDHSLNINCYQCVQGNDHFSLQVEPLT